MKWFIHQREIIEQPKTELVSIKNVVGHQGQTIHCLERPHEPTKTLELNNLTMYYCLPKGYHCYEEYNIQNPGC